MGYPVWQTIPGDLGKINAQEYFDLALEAVDPIDNGTITYTLVAGLLPKGLKISPNGYVSGNPEKIYTLEGVPFSTNVDIFSEFTIRATNSFDDTITDRTFNITVTGNFPPQIMTVTDPLGVFLDGTEVNLQLEALDLNNDPLVWGLTSGILPPGLELTSSGLITGVIKPQIYNFSTSIPGWDESKWDNNDWEFTARSSNATYNFTVSVTDGKIVTTKRYKIAVYAHNDVRADSISITTDSTRIYADSTQDRPPILLTKTLGDSATVNSGGYFAFKFDAIDYDVSPITYNINTSANDGFDADNWDSDIWDKDSFSLPPGLTLDPNTGWLTGYIPTQVETTKDYQFGIYVYSSDDVDNRSPTRLFTLTILGNLELGVSWQTDNDLGRIKNGSISNLSVLAVAAANRILTYDLKNGSRLPQGLTLLPDGMISGRVSFQTMGFDRGTTTFDKELASKFVYKSNTNFDNIYSFTVIAHDYYNQVSGEKTFTVAVTSDTYEPYENLYARCLPSVANRQALQKIISNTDMFDPADLYRPSDPYFGIQPEIKFLVSYGIKASDASEYIAAMQTRHFNKKFYFGDFKVAQGKDVNGNVLYDVVYVDIKEDTKIYENINGVIKNKIPAAFTNINNVKAKWRNPRARNLPQNQLHSDSSISIDKSYIKTADTYYLDEPLNVIAPNDLTLMQIDISNNLENTYLNSLPEWMITVQSNGRILGYTTGAVLAYLKPGAGPKALYNIKRYVPSDIKDIPLLIDRYVLNNSYTSNFDMAARRFISHKYTTFDLTSTGDNTIIPAFKADFAVDRPFDSINLQDLDYLLSTGGIDGITYNLDGKYVVFTTQEQLNATIDTDLWTNVSNDGWNDSLDQNTGGDPHILEIVIPGYQEKINTGTLLNKRGGIWQIAVDSRNVVKLNFVREINPGEYVYVNEGTRHANTYQLYDISTLSLGYSVPRYTQSYSSVKVQRLPTTFDKTSTIFLNNVDTYTIPFSGDKYLKFPKIGVFTNGQ